MVIVKFEGVDNWHHPIFKDVDGAARYGACGKLVDYDSKECAVLKMVSGSDLLYFGQSFGCKPRGTAAEVKIVGKDIDLKVVERAEKTIAWMRKTGAPRLNVGLGATIETCLFACVVAATRLRIYEHITPVIDVLKIRISNIEKLKSIISGDDKNAEKN